MTLRELQNNLQVDNSRLRTSVSAMVATGELAMKNGTYVPGFATYENPTAPGGSIPCTLVKLAARFGFASRDDGEGDIFSTISDVKSNESSLDVYAQQGGVLLVTPETQHVDVYNISGARVFAGSVQGNRFVSLAKGVYIVADKKIVVK